MACDRHAVRPGGRATSAATSSRVTSPCSALTPLMCAGGAQRQRRHVELRSAGRCRARRARGSAGGAGRVSPQQPARCFSTRWNGKASWPAGTGVCVVNTVLCAHRLERVVERLALLDVLADALQRDERGVAFVQVPHRRLDAQRAQRPHAADAEDDFLLDARLAIAAVEARRQLAVPGRVLVEVGVEQEQAHVADPHAPHRGQHRAIAERHGRDARLAVGRDRRFDRRVGPVDALVVFLLPAVVRHALVEVALRIHEADADERHAEVAGFLAVVAGQHAEAAGVDRQRLVQRELGGEVGDDLPLDVAAFGRVHHGCAGADARRRGRRWPRRRARRNSGSSAARCSASAPSVLQHPRRVVGRRAPERVVEPAEQPRAPRLSSSTRGRGRVRAGGECGRETGRRKRSIDRDWGLGTRARDWGSPEHGDPGSDRRRLNCRRRASRFTGTRPRASAKRERSMLPPDTTATTLPAPARPLSAAAIAQPPAPSAITCTRSAVSRMAAATSSSGTTIEPATGVLQQRPHRRQHRLAAGAVDERRAPGRRSSCASTRGERQSPAATRFPVRRRRPARRACARGITAADARQQAAAADAPRRRIARRAGPRGSRGRPWRCRR